jgi:hypothetical protein
MLHTDEFHSIAASHPIIHSVSSSDVIQRFTLRCFGKLLDAREWDIENTCLAAETAKHVGTVSPRFTNVQELVNYAKDTMSPILYPLLECYGALDEEEAYQIASHVYVAYGIISSILQV